jgi:hypothetical protein
MGRVRCRHRRVLALAGLGALIGLSVARTAAAQVSPGGADLIQREQRLRELQQLQLDNRQRVNTAIPEGQRYYFDYGAFVQFNYLSLDDPQGNNHGLRETDFIPYARLNIDGVHELFARGRFGWRDFNDGDSFDGRGDEPVDGDLERGYYRFDLQRAQGAYGKGNPGDFQLVFQGGRDLAYWANGLVLGQVLDGVMVTTSYGRLTLDAIAGVTPVRTVDIDPSRPNFDHNTRRGFYGGMLSADLGNHRPFLYGLYQRDYNEDDELTTGLIDTNYEYNSAYIGIGSAGAIGDRIRYGVEFAYEFGDTLSNSFEIAPGGALNPIAQTEDDISAWAFNAKLDYLANDVHETRLSSELILASGDDDRGTSSSTFNGNRAGTTDTGFNAFGLLNTGLAFAPDVSNLIVLRGGLATFPLPDSGAFRRMQVGIDVFGFAKFDSDAPIDEPTADTRFLGWEPDVYLNWQITSDLTLALRYGAFFPREEAFGNDDVRQFFYGGVTFAF